MMIKKATRQQIKDHNTQLVLRTIFERKDGHRSEDGRPDGSLLELSVSRAELSRLTGLTKTTVSEIVAGLIETGLVAETGLGESAGGKPPTMLQPIANARQVACLDLDSAEFRGALINLNGVLQHRVNIPIQELKGDSALHRVFVLLDALVSASSAPLLGIGIGTPGLVDPADKRIIQAVNLGWQNLPLGELLAARYHCPIYLVNDSHAAAMAEFTYRNKTRSENMILIKSGQGIGAGIIINGEIFHGDGFGTGEIGHLQVVENGLLCTCGKHGCLETVSSNRALISQAVKLGRLEPNQAERPESEVFLRLTEAYRQNDKIVQHLAYDAGRYFGVVVAGLATILNIHQIVISGAITAFGDILMDGIQEQVQQRVLSTVAGQVQVSFSRLENDSVMLGAGALTISKELGIYS